VRIWVDFSTAPDPLFFRPIVDRLHSREHTTWITARDFGETVSIAKQKGFDFRTVGKHGGQTVTGKAMAIFKRAWTLTRLARCEKINVAVSFNSYAQALAASMLRLPLVTFMDYEHQPANHIAFRLAKKIVVPKTFPTEALRRYGASEDRVKRYNGIKEDLYLADFKPNPSFLEDLGIPAEKVVVTMRPPATMATYHRFENPLFEEVSQYLLGQEVYIIYLPRTREQEERIISEESKNLMIPEEALDGLNLVYHSDLVISAGGTMNREAAVMGTPAYTVFKGRLGAVDQHLIDTGRMTIIKELADLNKIVLKKKECESAKHIGKPQLLDEVVDTILRAA
jgi:hypothetical protein